MASGIATHPHLVLSHRLHPPRTNLCRLQQSIQHFSVFFWIILLLVQGLASSEAEPQAPTLKYDIFEESAAGSKVADIKAEAHLAKQYDDRTMDRLRFTFLGQGLDYFVLDAVSGVISRSEARLDRESECPQAEDCVLEADVAIQPPFFQVIKVSFRLLDLNDNEPHFKKSDLALGVAEDTPLGPFHSIQLAQDRDSRRNGIADYKLEPKNNKFGLDIQRDSNGVVYQVSLVLLEELDREATDSYEVKVIAYDGGSPRLSGSVLINITIEDVNDNQPQFEGSSYEIEVREDLPPTKSLLRVHAKDPDSGDNGRVRYTLSDRTNAQFGHLFRADRDTGQIELLQSLDYEENSRVVLEVLAQDQGPGVTFPAVTRVIVHVIDVNDNPPEIHLDQPEVESENGRREEENTVLSVREHSPAGTFVVQMAVTDRDLKRTEPALHCSLLQTNESLAFQLLLIDEGDYRLRTTKEIDREINAEFPLTILCSDFGVPPLTSTKNVTVVIEDLNDNAPRFTQQTFNAGVAENNLVKQEILRVEASDADAGENARITYALQSDADHLFEIDQSSGSIWTTRSLDHEIKNQYRLLVVATDNGFPEQRFSTASVVVTVQDVNDEPPRFLQRKYQFSIEENQPSKTEVGQVKALDHDSHLYNKHTYHLESTRPNSHIGTFKVDLKSGTIYTRRALNREEKAVYNITVIVRDDDNPAFQDTTEVIVKVIDVNDNPPSILFPVPGNDTIYTLASTPKGHLLGVIKANDLDTDDNARLTFTVTEGNDLELFDVNSQTGDVTVRSDLSKFDQSTVRLTLRVTDNGVPRMESVATLRVRIGDAPVSAFHPSRSPSSPFDNHLIVVIVFVTGSLLIAFALMAIVCFVCRHRRGSKKRHLAADGTVISEKGHHHLGRVDEIIGDGDTDRGSDKSWKRASPLADDDVIENGLDGYFVINRNHANDMFSSPATTFDRRSRLYSANSDTGTICPCTEGGAMVGVGNGVGPMCLPQITDYNNGCCKLVSYRPIYCNSELGLSDLPLLPCPSPEWKLPQLVHQRRPSFSKWLNSESFQLQQKGQTYSVNGNGRVGDYGRVAATLRQGLEPTTLSYTTAEPRPPPFDQEQLARTYGGRPNPSPGFYNRLYPLGDVQNQREMKNSMSSQLIAGPLTSGLLQQHQQTSTSPPICDNKAESVHSSSNGSSE